MDVEVTLQDIFPILISLIPTQEGRQRTVGESADFNLENAETMLCFPQELPFGAVWFSSVCLTVLHHKREVVLSSYAAINGKGAPGLKSSRQISAKDCPSWVMWFFLYHCPHSKKLRPFGVIFPMEAVLLFSLWSVQSYSGVCCLPILTLL